MKVLQRGNQLLRLEEAAIDTAFVRTPPPMDTPRCTEGVEGSPKLPDSWALTAPFRSDWPVIPTSRGMEYRPTVRRYPNKPPNHPLRPF